MGLPVREPFSVRKVLDSVGRETEGEVLVQLFSTILDSQEADVTSQLRIMGIQQRGTLDPTII